MKIDTHRMRVKLQEDEIVDEWFYNRFRPSIVQDPHPLVFLLRFHRLSS